MKLDDDENDQDFDWQSSLTSNNSGESVAVKSRCLPLEYGHTCSQWNMDMQTHIAFE